MNSEDEEPVLCTNCNGSVAKSAAMTMTLELEKMQPFRVFNNRVADTSHSHGKTPDKVVKLSAPREMHRRVPPYPE